MGWGTATFGRGVAKLGWGVATFGRGIAKMRRDIAKISYTKFLQNSMPLAISEPKILQE
jgi:hypothetical protein